MSVTKVLSGHVSSETAYVVADYPYGFRLRCQMRYWLETNKRGTRMVSQTSNPKVNGLVWNKPKASTYSHLAALYLDENGHAQHAVVGAYSSIESMMEFGLRFAEGLTSAQQAELVIFIRLAQKMSAHFARKVA